MTKMLLESKELNTKYNNENNIYKKIDIIKEFGTEIPEIQLNLWERFVEDNPSPLMYEFEKYGFSKDNPFVQFILTYYMKNRNIDPFVGGSTTYNTLHELVSDDIIDSKQLSFKAYYDKNGKDLQLEILLNSSLWDKNKSTIIWLVKLWKWFSNPKNVYANINNKYILNIFFGGGDLRYKEKNNYVLSYTKVKKLKLATFFTDIIDEIIDLKGNISKENMKYFEEKLKTLEKSISIISSELNSYSLIRTQIKQFSEYTQESYRDAKNGRFQSTDSTEKYKPLKRNLFRLNNTFNTKTEDNRFMSEKDMSTLNFLVRDDREVLNDLKQLAKKLNSEHWKKLTSLLNKGQLNLIRGDLDIE